jgi:hypothetical protein
MIVYKDIFSGDEMVSDSYKMTLVMNDACMEVQAKFVTKGSDYVAIACKYIFHMYH